MRAPSSFEKNATARGRRVVSPGVVQRFDDLEPGEHTEISIVAATRPHGVDVRAAHDRWAVFRARAYRDGVTDGVDGNTHPELVHPPGDEIATFFVGVGEREAVAAAVIPCPPLGELVEAAHEPRPVDT